jgi:hypothetical protein
MIILKLSAKAKDIIDQHIVDDLCEVVYVLSSYYKIDRQS